MQRLKACMLEIWEHGCIFPMYFLVLDFSCAGVDMDQTYSTLIVQPQITSLNSHLSFP